VEGDRILEAKAGWLNPTGMLVRDVLGLAVLFGMMLWFAYHMLRPDLHEAPGPGIYRAISGGQWRGVPEEAMRSRKIAMRLAPVTALLFAFIWGMIGIDQAMTMLPHWFSTMFPVTFLISAFHSGLAMTAVMTVLLRRRLKLEEYITGAQFHDLGKLIFAYAVFWMYVNWSQYVVIWYGLLPHEQEFFVLRFHKEFALLTEIAVACIFVFPFLSLLPRAPKKAPGVLAGVSVVILIGHWLERFLITVPSVWDVQAHPYTPFGLTEIGISLGFAGLFFASYAWFLATFPVLPSPASLATIPTPMITVPARGAAARA
jgi:Ni/Fe-hydrogenase subunit HybB-like protein